MRFLLQLFLFSIAFSSTHYIPQDFSTIQNGIDISEPGDTILVSSGTYYENLNISSPLNLIANEGTIIDGSGLPTIISINSNDIVISNFEIIGDSLSTSGITILPGCNNIHIKNNIIHGMKLPNENSEIYASYGILAFGDGQGPPNPSRNIIIENNEIFDINAFGISLGSFTDSVLIKNNFIHDLDRIDLTPYGLEEDVSIGITGQFSGWVDVRDNSFSNIILGSNFFFSYGEVSNNLYDDTTRIFLSYNTSNPIFENDDYSLPPNALSKKQVEFLGIGTLMSLHFSHIQDAIDYADNESIVDVSSGVYYENITFNGKNISLIGENQLTTIIDGNHNGSVITFNNGENSNALLSNFTIINGNSDYGGGISIGKDIESSPRIINNIIKENTAQNGAGVYFNHSFSNFSNNVVALNEANGFGAGILSDNNGSREIRNCTIVNNIANNSGGGISSWSSDTIVNSIIYFNYASIDSNLNGNNNQIISYSSIENREELGLGNINSNPQFHDLNNHDYSLLSISPCIDSGDPNMSLDPDETTSDMGAYYYDQIDNPFPILIGDVNNDTAIDIIDIVMTVDIILDVFIPTNNQFDAADIDNNGSIDVIDIIFIIEIILDF